MTASPSPPPPAQEVKSMEIASENRETSVEIEIPLPPLPAAQDKDPTAMIDTRRDRFRESSFEKSLESEKDKGENASHNLPPGFNSKVPTVTVQQSHQTAPSMTAARSGLQPPGSQAYQFFGPPGTNYYGGEMPTMPVNPFSGK